MKKLSAVILALIVAFGLIIGLTACKKGNKSDSDLQKIQEAFDGVESSMQEVSTAQKVNKGIKMASGMSEDDPLYTLWSTWCSDNFKQPANTVDIEYNQPPMQQFQYLKAIFETMGDDYELGTKYYYDITGTMYFDMDTGFAVYAKDGGAENYKYDYVFGFAMSIELRDDDFIFAEVSFNIKLTKGNNTYKTTWYVRFDLDYDFDSEKPTYTLAMYTDNKEGELKFLNRVQGYEYDYVDVKNGEIKEWRKFCMDVDREIVFDATHTTFDDYINEGAKYNADTCKWLRNGVYYKIIKSNDAMSETRERSIANIFVNTVGMNSTYINSSAFINKEGKRNEVIDTYYKKICEVYRGDIIYDLVCKDEDEEGNGGNGDNGTTQWPANVVVSDVPAFSGSNLSFSYRTTTEGVIEITVNNATASDFNTFKASLINAGFTESEGAYYKPNDNEVVCVRIVGDKIYVAIAENEQTYNLEIPKAKPLTEKILSYGQDVFGDKKALSDAIGSLVGGRITVSEYNAFHLTGNDCSVYHITVDDINVINRYVASYNTQGQSISGNSILTVTEDAYDVLYIFDIDTDGSDPCLNLYVLTVDKGMASRILGVGTTVHVISLDGAEVINDEWKDVEGNYDAEDYGGFVFYDKDCTRRAPDTLEPYYGLTLYVQTDKENYESDDQQEPETQYNVQIVLVFENRTEQGDRLTYNTKQIRESDILVAYSGAMAVYYDETCEDQAVDVIELNADEITWLYLKIKENGGSSNGNGGNVEDPQDPEKPKDPEDPEGPGEYNEGDPNVKVTVTVAILDKNQNRVGEDTQYTYNNGQTIDVSTFITEDGQKVYREFPYSEDYVVDGTINAYDGLVLYVWKKLPTGKFRVYDVVDDEEPVLLTEFDAYIGSGDYFGHSFAYLLYWDAACTQPIDLYYDFNMTEDGITVYRHIYEDYFVLNVIDYVNDHPLEAITSRVLRKGIVYNAFGYGYGVVDDYPTSFYSYGGSVEFYLGEGKQNQMNEGSLIATTEDSLNVYIYSYSPEHHVYTIKKGEEVLTEDYVVTYGAFEENYYAEGMGNKISYKQYVADYCTLSGDTIFMHNVSSLKGPVEEYWVYDGRVLFKDWGYGDNYFSSESPVEYTQDTVGPSDMYFNDVNCSDPIVFTENEYGTGSYKPAGAKRIYKPFDISNVYVPDTARR